MHVDRFHSGTGTIAAGKLGSFFSSAFLMSAIRTLGIGELYGQRMMGKR